MTDDPNDPVEELMVRCLERPSSEWESALADATRERPEHATELCARMRLVTGVDLAPKANAFELPWRLGDFTCTERLGSGGMGIVFRARQESLGRDVAVKVVRPERLLFEGALTRFGREVETIARLNHPGIVAIHTVGSPRADAGELPYFAMELLEGASLARALRAVANRAPESLVGRDLFAAIGGTTATRAMFAGSWEDACLQVAEAIADALQHAHEHGVLHRDVKPSNIVLAPSGRAVLIDFGLTATRVSTDERFTASGHPVGTLDYMSPEQLEGRDDLDVRSDVYSLGVTLYELLALQTPFGAESPVELQRRILLGQVFSLRARNRHVTRDLEVIVAKALAPRRGDRYVSAGALRDDLQRLRAGRPILAKAPGFARVVSLWVRRRPAAALALGLGALLLVGVPSVYFALERRHSKALGALVVQERAAKEATLQANAELEDVLAFALGMFERAAPDDRGGPVPDAREMLRLGAAELPRLAERPSSRARIQLSLGNLFSMLTEVTAAQPQLDAAIEYYSGLADERSRARLAHALRLSGHNLLFLRRLDDAEVALRRALSLAEELYGPDALELHPYHATLADLARDRGRPDESVEWRRSTLRLLEGAPPTASAVDVARARGLLGVALKERGDYDEARTLMNEAVAFDDAHENALGAERDLLTLTLADLARIMGDHEQALALATDTRARLLASRGAASLLTLQATFAIGEIHATAGRPAEALPLLEEVAREAAQEMPASHPLLLRVRAYQLGALLQTGRAGEVVQLARELDLVELAITSLGPSDSVTISLLRSLAVALQAVDEHEASLERLVQLEAAERGARAWTGTHGDAVLMLAGQHMKLKRNGGDNDLAAPEALLREMIDALGETQLPVRSTTNGQTYEGGYMARLFLAGLVGADPERRLEAVELQANAEARKAAIMAAANADPSQ